MSCSVPVGPIGDHIAHSDTVMRMIGSRMSVEYGIVCTGGGRLRTDSTSSSTVQFTTASSVLFCTEAATADPRGPGGSRGGSRVIHRWTPS